VTQAPPGPAVRDQDDGGPGGLAFDDVAAGGAADLLVGGEQEDDGARGLDLLVEDAADGVEGQETAGFHVVDAGAVGFFPFTW